MASYYNVTQRAEKGRHFQFHVIVESTDSQVLFDQAFTLITRISLRVTFYHGYESARTAQFARF